jgi:electron transfer flavoprotein alpha subunit
VKIALVITAQGNARERQLGEMSAFLACSGLQTAECEIWLVASELPVLPETLLVALESQFQRAPKDLLLFASGMQGNELATRLAYRLKGDAFCGVTRGFFGSQPEFSRPVYGNAMVGTFTAGERPWCVSVARSARHNLAPQTLTEVTLLLDSHAPAWLVEIKRDSAVPRPALQQARCVIAVGKGVAGAQNMKRIHEIAERLGAEIGASRQVVMNAWCEMERLIGMSGSVIAPQVCIAAGVSGAPAFSMGIRDSGLIVAINTDPDAPIFAEADVIIVEEFIPVLEALVACIAGG